MKFIRILLPLFLIASLPVFKAEAQLIGQDNLLDRRVGGGPDDTAVREFVESKENIDLREKASNIEISGDVRFDWQNLHEKGVVLFRRDDFESRFSSVDQEYRNLRGSRLVGFEGIPLSNNDFAVKFNLKVKYDFDKTWCMGHVQFSNSAGIVSNFLCRGTLPVFNESGSALEGAPAQVMRSYGGFGSGTVSGITLKRAYMGHNIIGDGKNRFDVEMGRRQLEDVFMSEVQFYNYFDGVLLEYARDINEDSMFYAKFGVFVVDQRVNHFAWATEIGLLGLFDTNWDFRYSFIDWRKERGINRCFITDPIGCRFNISQFMLAYDFDITLCDKEIPVEFYAAFLVNTAARKNKFTDNKLANCGWYIDFYANNVIKKGDWSFEILYAAIQAQCVPDFDVRGIGRGNILNERFTDVLTDVDFSSYSPEYYSEYSSSSEIEGYFPGRGNANYHGLKVDFLYAITDTFSVDTCYQISQALDHKIGGKHFFSNFEVQFIYAF